MNHPRVKWLLIAGQTLMAAAMLPWLFSAGASLAAFDAPGAEGRWSAWLFVLIVWSYPFWALLGTLMSWFLYRRRSLMWALVACGLPSLAAVVFICYAMGTLW